MRKFKNKTLCLCLCALFAVDSHCHFLFFRNTRSHEMRVRQSATLSRHCADEFVQESVSSVDV